MKYITKFLIILSLFTANSYGKEFQADKFVSSKPLITIRFNKSNVNYSNYLKQAVKRAQELDKETKYIIYTYFPAGKANAEKFALANVKAIEHEVMKSGVSKNFIITKAVPSKKIENNEVAIYLSK